MNAVPQMQYYVSRHVIKAGRLRKTLGLGPTLLRKRSQKVAEHLTDPETSSELGVLLTRDALNTQPMCVTSFGNEVSLITLNIEVAKIYHFEH